MSELEIIDTTKGARLVPAGSEAGTPVFVLVPWEEVVGSGKQASGCIFSDCSTRDFGEQQ